MTKKAERRPIIRLALSREEVAISIGVSVGSVDQMVAEGALPPPRQWHSRKLWLVAEVEAHLSDWPVEGEVRSRVHRATERSEEVQTYEPAEDRKGPGGYPIPAQDSPIWTYYNKLGFDPYTMDRSDMERLMAKADAEWRASMPGTPLNRREEIVMRRFPEFEVDTLIKFDKIKGLGINTAERLEARGFLKIQYHERDRLKGCSITGEGMRAARGL